MGKLLILFGAVLIVAGLLIEYGAKIPYLGRLPGDIVVENKNYKLYFPIVTSILISILLSLVIYIINKLKD
jgi:hypothetical protein